MTSHASRAKILAVDDDPGILRVISRVFGQQYAVTCASGGEAALKAAAESRPDVAIVDIRMPEMNGFELMRALHRDRPELDVILMTGNAEECDANLVQAIDAGAFYFIQKPFERRVLLALVGRCLELRRLREEKQRYLEQLETELEEARQFQMSLLPPFQTQLGPVSIAARYVACRELAGDFYDYAQTSDGAVSLLVADVVGHGASAAMMTGIVKSAFHAARVDGFDPLGVIDRVKDGLRAFDESRFITLCCVRWEVDRRLTYANAGHPPPILRRAGHDLTLLESTGPLISSALAEIPCEKGVVDVEDGDLLLLYTDGITEAQGPSGMFGRERILSLLTQNGFSGPQLLDEMLARVAEFSEGRSLEDDMTLLAAETPSK